MWVIEIMWVILTTVENTDHMDNIDHWTSNRQDTVCWDHMGLRGTGADLTKVKPSLSGQLLLWAAGGQWEV